MITDHLISTTNHFLIIPNLDMISKSGNKVLSQTQNEIFSSSDRLQTRPKLHKQGLFAANGAHSCRGLSVFGINLY